MVTKPSPEMGVSQARQLKKEPTARPSTYADLNNN